MTTKLPAAPSDTGAFIRPTSLVVDGAACDGGDGDGFALGSAGLALAAAPREVAAESLSEEEDPEATKATQPPSTTRPMTSTANATRSHTHTGG
ncbi:hypothetical protein GORBP_070_00260 [Gordonia rubripertincta NBRC 101908]|uniref:Uncharacterized protein n=1 Tax=Gordonia rubripertincta NBRC 101908 TaxID=1077975 RepID=A0ABQ0HVD2_GORRU|nr:hypothetical protein GORBP_070_00260 [Gordonia rubripertincta NBRC 101908]